MISERRSNHSLSLSYMIYMFLVRCKCDIDDPHVSWTNCQLSQSSQSFTETTILHFSGRLMVCIRPGRKVDRSKMLYCTRCNRHYYCSQECQRAAWPMHKADCDLIVDLEAKFESDPDEYEKKYVEASAKFDAQHQHPL